MQTDRTTSRCALAVIQIWASDADASSFAHWCGCPHDSRPYPSVGILPLRPRRAFWQVINSIARVRTNIKYSAACGQQVVHPPLEKQGFPARFL